MWSFLLGLLHVAYSTNSKFFHLVYVRFFFLLPVCVCLPSWSPHYFFFFYLHLATPSFSFSLPTYFIRLTPQFTQSYCAWWCDLCICPSFPKSSCMGFSLVLLNVTDRVKKWCSLFSVLRTCSVLHWQSISQVYACNFSRGDGVDMQEHPKRIL